MKNSNLKIAALVAMSFMAIGSTLAEDNKPAKDGTIKVGDYKKVDCNDKTKCGSDWYDALPDKPKPVEPKTSKRLYQGYSIRNRLSAKMPPIVAKPVPPGTPPTFPVPPKPRPGDKKPIPMGR